MSQSDIRAFARGEMGVVRADATRALDGQLGTATAYHLRDVIARIDAILEPGD